VVAPLPSPVQLVIQLPQLVLGVASLLYLSLWLEKVELAQVLVVVERILRPFLGGVFFFCFGEIEGVKE
jgi:hypothetical protein